MRAILLALVWGVELAGTVTTRSSGDDNRAGEMLQAELEANDLAAAAAEHETTQQLEAYADMYPEGSELRCALAYAARPAGPAGRRSKGCQVALSQKKKAMLVKATASMDALCTRYGRERVERAVADSPAGQAGVGSARCCEGCRHRLSALMASGPEEAEAPAEAAETAAGGAGEHATGHQAAPGEEAERNDNDPLDGASQETRIVVRMAMEIRRVNARCAVLEEQVGKKAKLDKQRVRRKKAKTKEVVADKAAGKRVADEPSTAVKPGKVGRNLKAPHARMKQELAVARKRQEVLEEALEEAVGNKLPESVVADLKQLDIKLQMKGGPKGAASGWLRDVYVINVVAEPPTPF
jgi:hypothetical protein